MKTAGWHSKTAFCVDLHTERFRRYPDGVKIVPPDISINPSVLLWWYLGDGFVAKYGAFLCTDSFTTDDNLRLVSLLSEVGIPCHLTPSNRIRIEGEGGFSTLIDYIGASPVRCYDYKWGGKIGGSL